MDDEIIMEEGAICIYDKRDGFSESEMTPENILCLLPQVVIINAVCEEKNTCEIITPNDKLIKDVNFDCLKPCNMLPEIIKEMLDKIVCATISIFAQQNAMQDDDKKNKLH